MGLAWSDYRYPEVSPNYEEAATFDPLIGFPNGREERSKLCCYFFDSLIIAQFFWAISFEMPSAYD